MSRFTIITLSFVVLAIIGKFFVDIDNAELRNNKYYRIFVIISGILALIVLIIFSLDLLKILLSIISFFKDTFA